MRVAERIEIAAPASRVWAEVSDPSRAPQFMAGITRWEVAGPARTGLGARYRMLLRVGAADVGGLIEVVEYLPEQELAWTSVTGVDQRGRTRVELRLQYGVAGSGISGWLAEHLAAPTVRGHVRRTLRQLKRAVEHEQLRAW
jgi:uncharacterized membrane protein